MTDQPAISSEERRAAWWKFLREDKNLHISLCSSLVLCALALIDADEWTLGTLGFLIAASIISITWCFCQFHKFHALAMTKLETLSLRKMYRVCKHPLFPPFWKYLACASIIAFYTCFYLAIYVFGALIVNEINN